MTVNYIDLNGNMGIIITDTLCSVNKKPCSYEEKVFQIKNNIFVTVQGLSKPFEMVSQIAKIKIIENGEVKVVDIDGFIETHSSLISTICQKNEDYLENSEITSCVRLYFVGYSNATKKYKCYKIGNETENKFVEFCGNPGSFITTADEYSSRSMEIKDVLINIQSIAPDIACGGELVKYIFDENGIVEKGVIYRYPNFDESIPNGVHLEKVEW